MRSDNLLVVRNEQIQAVDLALDVVEWRDKVLYDPREEINSICLMKECEMADCSWITCSCCSARDCLGVNAALREAGGPRRMTLSSSWAGTRTSSVAQRCQWTGRPDQPDCGTKNFHFFSRTTVD